MDLEKLIHYKAHINKEKFKVTFFSVDEVNLTLKGYFPGTGSKLERIIPISEVVGLNFYEWDMSIYFKSDVDI